MVQAITSEQLKAWMDSDQGMLILDLRSSLAFEKWRIEGKHAKTLNLQHIKIKEMGIAVADMIPADKPVVAVCEKGILARQTAAFLESIGYDASFLSGGMQSWSEYYETVPVNVEGSAQIYQIIRPAKGCLSYLVASGNEALVIDPGRHIEVYQKLAEEKKVSICHVVDTHLHADHISGGVQLAQATGSEYWAPEEEMKDSLHTFSGLADNNIFSLGREHVEIVSLKTPGHTVSSMCLLLGDQFLFSGDTLFVNGVGRPDLKGRVREMAQLLFQTVTQIMNRFHDELIVLPGHFSKISEINNHGFIGEALGRIKARNDLLNMKLKEEFVTSLMSRIGETPPNFELITKINQGKYQAGMNEQAELENGPNRCTVEQTVH